MHSWRSGVSEGAAYGLLIPVVCVVAYSLDYVCLPMGCMLFNALRKIVLPFLIPSKGNKMFYAGICTNFVDIFKIFL